MLGTVLGASESAPNSRPHGAFIVVGRQKVNKVTWSRTWRNKRGWSASGGDLSIKQGDQGGLIEVMCFELASPRLNGALLSS